MKMHFDLRLVRKLLDHSKAATERNPSFDQLYEGQYRHDATDVPEGIFPESGDVDKTKVPSGLWLVGDSGVYLMSNGLPRLLEEGSTEKSLVAYAAEADPRLDFDVWWRAKNASFGHDDGVEFLSAALIEEMIGADKDDVACLDISTHQIKPERSSMKSMPKHETAMPVTGNATKTNNSPH